MEEIRINSKEFRMGEVLHKGLVLTTGGTYGTIRNLYGLCKGLLSEEDRGMG